jgi:hypothetical protein
MMGGEIMTVYLFIGIFTGIGIVSAWNITQILYTNYTVRRERERYQQERAEFENRPKGH